MKKIMLILSFFSGAALSIIAQDTIQTTPTKPKVLYGTASYYSNKFVGRKTADGEIFSQEKMTAACNVLPLGTWIKVTNLRNGRSVTVKINDRLHSKMKRVVDLTRSGAKKLGFINAGITRVKVEVLGNKKPEN
jgi:rare lipoprotein A